ncbi:hypothetical protein Bpfe_012827 [Biomphalaria pfeifferi]|uniref:Uncharacterized protein n=1 Tax=Biomphalaria pfeifferi TaxID=112525 RepID=A0AAD8BMW0_BIOPF|nr:hypothetical protein Bpfe_012827 [Biomphalaria pfeifferi]
MAVIKLLKRRTEENLDAQTPLRKPQRSPRPRSESLSAPPRPRSGSLSAPPRPRSGSLSAPPDPARKASGSPQTPLGKPQRSRDRNDFHLAERHR